MAKKKQPKAHTKRKTAIGATKSTVVIKVSPRLARRLKQQQQRAGCTSVSQYLIELLDKEATWVGE
jgi:hypothetical protein